MKSANAPFNEFGQSMILRDIEDLYIDVANLGKADSAFSMDLSLIVNSINAISSTLGGLGTMSTQNANAVAITGGTITGITDLAVADGGTGASTAGGARTNLGLGTISVLDSPLPVANGGTALVTVAQDRILYTSALDTFSATTITSFGRLFIACVDAAAGRTQLGLGTLATASTPLAVSLGGTAKSGITSGTFWYASSTDTLSEATITAFGRSLVDDAAASDGRTTLGLGSIATQASSSVSITGGTITGITDLAVADGGTGASDIANFSANLRSILYDVSTAYSKYTTPGAGTHTFTAGVRFYVAVVIGGGGGGGGGTAGTAGGSGAGAGGGAGEMVIYYGRVTGSGSTMAYTVGAGGSAGGTGSGGSAGSDSIWNAVHAATGAGGGGPGSTPGRGGGNLSSPPYNGSTTSELNLRFAGQNGGPGAVTTITTVTNYSTQGGLGGGGYVTDGTLTNQYGGGGAGGSAGSAGVAGKDGVIYVWEK